MKNIGKVFETQFSNSVPPYALLYRLSDSAQSFGGCNNLRFSSKSPFDYILWDSNKRILYALELKTAKGKSISFERTKEDHGEIHWHQIAGLEKWSKYNGITAGLIIEFRELETTVFIAISEFRRLIDVIPKKSFNFKDLEIYDIQYTIIGQTKLRTRYKYDVDSFLAVNKRQILFQKGKDI